MRKWMSILTAWMAFVCFLSIANANASSAWLPPFLFQSSEPATIEDDSLPLLDWMLERVSSSHLADLYTSVPPYNRRKHFGTWIRPDSETCYDTRATVLMRDSPSSAIQFFPNDTCKVRSGSWHDPYTGHKYKMANALQIDHVVPLRHSYYTGAWKWTYAKRCNYANFLKYPAHLLPVNASENMSKSDGNPEKYMPPNKSYACKYLGNWMRIKAIWDLVTTSDEMQAIREIAQEHNCDLQKEKISKSELARQQQNAEYPPEGCLKPRDLTSSEIPEEIQP